MEKWNNFLSQGDLEIYREAGYGRVGGGGLRPALIIIDVTHEFVGDKPEPALDSIKKFPNSCGQAGWDAMNRIAELLEVCRKEDIPVLYTKGMDDRDALSRGSWGWKKAPEAENSLSSSNTIGNTIPDLIAPMPGERVIQKTKPSAFFGTPLASYLIHLGVDTLIVTGTTTSGCIRATVLDSFSLNFRTLVVEDATFDRIEASHVMNCFDMNSKYADVLSTEETLTYLDGLPGRDVGSLR